MMVKQSAEPKEGWKAGRFPPVPGERDVIPLREGAPCPSDDRDLLTIPGTRLKGNRSAASDRTGPGERTRPSPVPLRQERLQSTWVPRRLLSVSLRARSSIG